MRLHRSKLLHLGILALLLLGWGQQLCAQADMLCNTEPVAAETAESCHEAPPAPEEPAPVMECCDAPEGVAAASYGLETPSGSQPVVCVERQEESERRAPTAARPEAPPPDLLLRHCTLLL